MEVMTKRFFKSRLPKHDPSRLVNCYMPHCFSLLLLSPACFPLLKYSPIFAVNLPERFSPDLILRSQTRPRPDLSGILHLPSQKHYSNTSPKLVLHFQTRPSAAADLLIFSPTSPLPFIILNTSLASKIFCRTTPWQQCCWWGTSLLLSFLEFEDVL